MKLFQRFFILGSSLFTFFCFSFPWIDGESGFQLIVGEGLHLSQISHLSHLSKIHLFVGEISFLSLFSLLVTFMTIGCIFFWQSKPLQTNRIIIGCSCIGISLLLILLLSNLQFIEYGLALTIVGFFLTIAGVRFFPKPE